MKAIPRKTAPPSIAEVWFAPIDKPLGYVELRHEGRVVAVVEPVNHRRLGAFSVCDWRFQVFGKEGQVAAEQTLDHGVQARERAYQIAERLRKKGIA